ncbi:MAG: hypothetical protein OIF47_04375 [Marinibacterium sp.]|nr:hypothetical protein [Marinibacterium sp.]
MSDISRDLLAADALARQFGVAMNPRLRAALEGDTRFPARAASPRPQAPVSPETLPQNVVPLSPAQSGKGRKQA